MQIMMETWRTSCKMWFNKLLLIFIVLVNVVVADASQLETLLCPIKSIYQFGDSISDTGNAIRLVPTGLAVSSRRPPYGETFPGKPTGRFSDGRLIIDYIATAIGVPLLNPYLDKKASFDNGVNFAVAGSTTLDNSFFVKRGIVPLGVPSLTVQLRWFKKYLSSICSTLKDCGDKLYGALIFVGESGYNDVGFPYVEGRSVQEIRTYLPLVVHTIINTTREVILAGASKVIVPGNFPLGCIPLFLSTINPSNDPTVYDDLKCLKSLNNLTSYQNNYLQQSLESLRNEFPNVVILYADYYNAFLTILREASSFGFDTRNLYKACCGVEGQYSPLSPGFCGNVGVPVCPNPNLYIHWDGIHLTQEAYRRISEIIITDLGINCTH